IRSTRTAKGLRGRALARRPVYVDPRSKLVMVNTAVQAGCRSRCATGDERALGGAGAPVWQLTAGRMSCGVSGREEARLAKSSMTDARLVAPLAPHQPRPTRDVADALERGGMVRSQSRLQTRGRPARRDPAQCGSLAHDWPTQRLRTHARPP